MSVKPLAKHRGWLLLLLIAISPCWCAAAQEIGAPEAAAEGSEPSGDSAAEEHAAAADDEPPGADADDVEEAAAPPFDPEGLAAVNKALRQATEDAPAEEDENANATRETDRATGFFYYLQVFAALSILCGGIILLGWVLRRLGGRTRLLAGQRLGTVMGRVSLTPRASLHYVRSADRVLVIGVTQNAVNLVSEFPLEAFGEVAEEPPAEAQDAPDFMAHLRGAAETPAPAVEDEDLTTLRGDLQRLKRYLKQDSGGSRG